MADVVTVRETSQGEVGGEEPGTGEKEQPQPRPVKTGDRLKTADRSPWGRIVYIVQLHILTKREGKRKGKDKIF